MSDRGDPLGFLGMKPTVPADVGIPAVPAASVQEGVGGPRQPVMPGLAAGTPMSVKKVAMPALRGGGLKASGPLAQAAAAAQAQAGASAAPPMAGTPSRAMAARAQRMSSALFRGQ